MPARHRQQTAHRPSSLSPESCWPSSRYRSRSVCKTPRYPLYRDHTAESRRRDQTSPVYRGDQVFHNPMTPVSFRKSFRKSFREDIDVPSTLRPNGRCSQKRPTMVTLAHIIRYMCQCQALTPPSVPIRRICNGGPCTRKYVIAGTCSPFTPVVPPCREPPVELKLDPIAITPLGSFENSKMIDTHE